MFTIKDYIKYYKNISFNECSFNINDVLLFTEISYIDFSDIVSNVSDRISLEKAFTMYLKSKNVYLSSFMKENIDNIKNIYTSIRYKDIYLSNYREEVNDNMQFGAITIHFDNKVFISYRGTNGTVAGWKEDFTLGYEYPVLSQKASLKYLNEVITPLDKEIYVGGHSKGGNLAMYASMYVSDDIFKRIKNIYNLDGPGFRKEYLKDFRKITTKLKIYIPEDSIIGLLLYSNSNKEIVKSNSSGIFEHDINNWICFGSFLVEGKLSKISIRIDNRIKSWYKNYSLEEIKEMILAFFNVLEINNIKNFRELKKLKLNQILGIINEINGIDDDTKKLYSETIRDLIWINNKK